MSSPCDLISLEATQAWLGQSSDGPLLSGLITQISRAILTWLGRPTILPAAFTEERDGDGRHMLILRNWPVVDIARVVVDGRELAAAPPLSVGAPLGSGYVLEAADPFPPGRMQALLLRGERFHYGRRNVAISYSAGYRVEAEQGVVAAQGDGGSVTARQPFGAWGGDCGAAYVDGPNLTRVEGPPQEGQYSVAGGVYVFAPQDVGRAVELAYGYVPSDLAEAAMEWTAERYSYRNRIGQRSKGLGGQETVSYDISPIPGFVAAALQPYRRTAWPC